MVFVVLVFVVLVDVLVLVEVVVEEVVLIEAGFSIGFNICFFGILSRTISSASKMT